MSNDLLRKLQELRGAVEGFPPAMWLPELLVPLVAEAHGLAERDILVKADLDRIEVIAREAETMLDDLCHRHSFEAAWSAFEALCASSDRGCGWYKKRSAEQRSKAGQVRAASYLAIEIVEMVRVLAKCR